VTDIPDLGSWKGGKKENILLHWSNGIVLHVGNALRKAAKREEIHEDISWETNVQRTTIICSYANVRRDHARCSAKKENS